MADKTDYRFYNSSNRSIDKHLKLIQSLNVNVSPFIPVLSNFYAAYLALEGGTYADMVD